MTGCYKEGLKEAADRLRVGMNLLNKGNLMPTGPNSALEKSRLAEGRAPASGKGGYGSKIIKTIKRDGRIWELHATKGWRSYRSPAQ